MGRINDKRNIWSDQGKRMVALRKTMGLKQYDVYRILGIDPGNYSKMEYGVNGNDKALDYLISEYRKWLPERVKMLESQIQDLKDLLI